MSDSDTDDNGSFPKVPILKPGIKDWERVGMPGQGLIGNMPVGRIERAMLEPIERFRIYVDAIARGLNNWDNINISEQNIERLLEVASQLKTIEHKNPTAYILGFLATGGGIKLDKKNFDNVVNEVLPHVEDTTVFPPDIIRYSRLWENL